MLVAFATDIYTDITMFGDPVLAVLKMMRHGAAVSGAILIADVVAVLKRLVEAVDAEKILPQVEDKDVNELPL